MHHATNLLRQHSSPASTTGSRCSCAAAGSGAAGAGSAACTVSASCAELPEVALMANTGCSAGLAVGARVLAPGGAVSVSSGTDVGCSEGLGLQRGRGGPCWQRGCAAHRCVPRAPPRCFSHCWQSAGRGRGRRERLRATKAASRVVWWGCSLWPLLSCCTVEPEGVAVGGCASSASRCSTIKATAGSHGRSDVGGAGEGRRPPIVSTAGGELTSDLAAAARRKLPQPKCRDPASGKLTQCVQAYKPAAAAAGAASSRRSQLAPGQAGRPCVLPHPSFQALPVELSLAPPPGAPLSGRAQFKPRPAAGAAAPWAPHCSMWMAAIVSAALAGAAEGWAGPPLLPRSAARRRRPHS